MTDIEHILNLYENIKEEEESSTNINEIDKPQKRVKRYSKQVPKRGTKEYESYRRKCLNGTIKKNGRPFDPDVIAKEKKEKARKYRNEYYRKYRKKKREEKKKLIKEMQQIAKANGEEYKQKRKKYKKRSRVKFLTYEEAKDIVQYEGIKSAKQYNVWYKYNKPASMPANPYNFFKLDGTWVSWKDFLGVSNSYPAFPKVKWRPYKEALVYAQTLHNVTTAKQWMELGKQGKLPPDIPVRPDITYRSYGNEWISWSVFLRKKGQISSMQYIIKNTDALLYILKVNDPILKNLYKIGVTIGGLSSIRDAVIKYNMQFIKAYNVGQDVDTWKSIIERYGEEHWEMPTLYEINNIHSMLLDLDQIWLRLDLS